MKIIYLPLLVILYIVPVFLADPIDNVASLIRQGNAHELAKLFAPSVEIGILKEENVYPKVQAELIVDKFFSENKPLTVKMLHNVSSNPNYKFAVLILNTDKGTFRVAYTMKQVDGNLVVISLRIETEQVK
jgi:hypothetical protein